MRAVGDAGLNEARVNLDGCIEFCTRVRLQGFPVRDCSIPGIARRRIRPAFEVIESDLVRRHHAGAGATLDGHVAQGHAAFHVHVSDGAAAVLDDRAGAAVDADLTDDVQDHILGRNARGQRALNVDAEGLGFALQQALAGQHMTDLGGTDTEGQRPECAMGAGVAVAADNGHAGLGGPQFRTHDVDDAPVGTVPGMHLDFVVQAVLQHHFDWVGGWGIDIISGRAQATTSTSSSKLYDLITATGEYTVEAWVVPANVTQEGPARIISYAGSETERNFTLGQIQYNYDFQQRSGGSLTTADADEDLQATLQHVVVTYDPVNGRRIYVNGIFTDDIDTTPAGSLADWVNNFAFVVGNEVSGNRQWQGKIRLLAIHNRALTDEQITQNFSVGVGEKFFLLFSVTDETGVPDGFVVFEVSQFDNYSYLFNQPFFISLDPTVTPNNIPLAGMRIGINGKEATVGQAYQNINTIISSSLYTPGTGQLLSDLGTIIALEKGPDLDEFFLTFEVLGTETNVVLEPAPVTPAAAPDLPAVADIGVRNFDEINATMSEVTGVPRNQVDVGSVFLAVKQQLPTVENIEGFLSAHQMAVAQLAIEYCSALVDNNGQILRNDYFQDSAGINSFNFSETADTAFDSLAKRDLVILPLLDKIIGTGLTTQPDPGSAELELDKLIDILGSTTACPPQPSCNTLLRTEQVVKATCAAALGSAAMLIQ